MRDLLNSEFGMRNSELFAKLNFVRRCEANQLVKLSTACEGSRGRGATLVALRRERNSLNFS